MNILIIIMQSLLGTQKNIFCEKTFYIFISPAISQNGSPIAGDSRDKPVEPSSFSGMPPLAHYDNLELRECLGIRRAI